MSTFGLYICSQLYIHLIYTVMFALVSSVSAVIRASPLHVFSQVQSFMRGWLCRRKWKIIVQDYICSPHAESMRKRNQIVFNMVEAETEYVLQLSILVNCFLRPLRMAASSKKPPISHDNVSSIFLNRYNSCSDAGGYKRFTIFQASLYMQLFLKV